VTETMGLTGGTRGLSLGITQLLSPWLPEVISTAIKRSGRKVDHSCQSSVKAKNARSYASTPTLCLHSTDRDSFTYTER
jgi:hypothetical protein